MGNFALQIAAWVEKTKGDMDLAVRQCAMIVDAKLVFRSPVGDPSKWATPLTQSRKTGKMHFNRPKGYVGGRFRGAWMVSIGSPDNTVSTVFDPNGKLTMEAHKSIIGAAKAGDILYFQNNMPYAQRLENGWSKQAPIGMVALVVVEWQSIVDSVVNGIRSGASAADFAQGFETYSL